MPNFTKFATMDVVNFDDIKIDELTCMKVSLLSSMSSFLMTSKLMKERP